MKNLTRALTILVLAAMPAASQTVTETIAPEGATALGAGASSPEIVRALAAKTEGRPVAATDWIVVAANSLAVETGARVLRNGGSASDAMVAVWTCTGSVSVRCSI